MAVYGSENNRNGNFKRDYGYSDKGKAKSFGRQKDRDDLIPEKHTMLDAETYVDAAEAVIKLLVNSGKLLTTSKIRNLLSMISSLYDEVRRKRADKLDKEEKEQIQYIRLHFAYEAGRDGNVKKFVQAADIFNHIKDIGENKERFILFCKYMEALVAYHRFYGGKE